MNDHTAPPRTARPSEPFKDDSTAFNGGGLANADAQRGLMVFDVFIPSSDDQLVSDNEK